MSFIFLLTLHPVASIITFGNDFQIGEEVCIARKTHEEMSMTATKVKYKTKQREKMQEFLKENTGKHFTAYDVCDYFKNKGEAIGTTTVYRQLDTLVKEGVIKKYLFDESSSACFEYDEAHDHAGHRMCYHLKCTECGKLIHLKCEEIEMFEHHIFEHHGFAIDSTRTVFYGLCEECAKKAKKE